MSKRQTILVISDLHVPFDHPDAVQFLRALKKKYKPTDVISIGDEVDYHALSFHDSDPDLHSAGDELKMARKRLKEYAKLFPKMTIIESNHGSMVMRKALANGLPKDMIKSYQDILQVPKTWKWVFDTVIQTPMGPVYFCHGKAVTSGRMASQFGMSVIQGHFHSKAQITYISTPERLMFDAHTGCLADDKSLALGYNKIDSKRPVVSLILIENGVPRILPMILKKGGRWNGYVP